MLHLHAAIICQFDPRTMSAINIGNVITVSTVTTKYSIPILTWWHGDPGDYQIKYGYRDSNGNEYSEEDQFEKKVSTPHIMAPVIVYKPITVELHGDSYTALIYCDDELRDEFPFMLKVQPKIIIPDGKSADKAVLNIIHGKN